MSTAEDYIPSPHNEFNDFQINLVTMTDTNKAAWGIAPAKVTALQAAQATYQPFYTAIANPNDRTKAKNNDHKEARKVYEKIIRDFVKENLRYNSAITVGEKTLLGINPGMDTPSSRPPIATLPYVLLKALGGLQVQIECRVESDSTLPSIHPDSDGIELRVTVSSVGPNMPTPPVYQPGDNPPPSNYNDAGGVVFSSKARFTKILDEPAFKGRYFYAFARWRNTSDEAKSSPWSEMASVLIN